MLLFIVASLSLFFLLKWIFEPDPSPLLLVYSRASKWYPLKFHLMKFVIGHRQKKKDTKQDDLMNSQFGSGGERSASELETKHELPKEKSKAADAVFFDAASKEGFYFTLGTAQRQNNIINLFFILRIPNRGLFIAPEMLTNTNVEAVMSKKEWKTKSGFTVRCEEPMKRWIISFKGNVVPYNKDKPKIFTEIGAEDTAIDQSTLVPCSFDLTWNCNSEYFDFDKNVSPTSIAHSLALEPWSRELFDKMKASHQSHYEQFGVLKGRITVGEKTDQVEMISMRDHTITSHRDWSEIRRYIMMIYHLDDGTCVHTSLISMPGVVFSHLEFGYLITPEKQNKPVDRINLHLANIGEKKGEFPEFFNYTFEAGGKTYNVEVNIIDSVSFKMGMDQACYVVENMAQFNVNGVKGRGFVEIEYRIQPY